MINSKPIGDVWSFVWNAYPKLKAPIYAYFLNTNKLGTIGPSWFGRQLTDWLSIIYYRLVGGR